MSGLESEQLDELEWRIAEFLEEPWDKGIGCPKKLTLREAVIITSGYVRQNIIEAVWAEIFDTSQPTISRIITKFTPLIEKATAQDTPSDEAGAGDLEAAGEAEQVRHAVLDGGLLPVGGVGVLVHDAAAAVIRENTYESHPPGGSVPAGPA
jgi:hypothetical protein